MSKVFFLISLFLFSSDAFPNSELDLHCDTPHWASPAESTHGTFRGDLLMDCWIGGPDKKWEEGIRSDRGLEPLKIGIIDRLASESTIHEGPISFKMDGLPSLRWDVTHRIQEDGNSVIIREEAVLATDGQNQLIYRTRSKEVSASGMASYLRSANFSMSVEKTGGKPIHIEFRNEVRVDRPWYALDLIFAPIARNVCFDKMEKIKGKLLPWVVTYL